MKRCGRAASITRHPIGIGDDSSIKAGFKYLDRHKVNNQDKNDYKAGKTPWALTNVGYTADSGFYDDMFHFGERINYGAARELFRMANAGVARSTRPAHSPTRCRATIDVTANDHRRLCRRRRSSSAT